ncbi:MAG: hypothetical protein PHI88_02095 [Candidatus Pacebacteria bacterium]|nr:hypothetical protein [Candidatus Paceibacterota bacterium]
MLVIFLLALVVGSGIYFWQRNQTVSEPIVVTPTPEATPTEKVDSGAPTKVVEDFMKYTLGTLPDSNIDYETARNLFIEDLKSQYSDDSFVPRFYGIQDGPDSAKFISENISDNEATVRVDVSFGEMTTAWAFLLKKEGDLWLISGFRNDAQ